MNRFLVCREMRVGAPQKVVSWLGSFNLVRSIHSIPFATVDVEEISGSQPAEVHNLVQGKWKGSSSWNTLLDPLNGEPFIKVAEVDETGVQPFIESLSKCPKHGLHNPFKEPERYLLFGDISAKAAHMLSLPKVSDFFTRLIQRVSPKSYQQALGEVVVTQKFLENFSGDQVFCSTWKSSRTAKSWFSLALWSCKLLLLNMNDTNRNYSMKTFINCISKII
ncbi:probable aldehyde dehydrogenase isoform X2 [Corylus avellana]|uniref:probable aldehyde dehydrogenase isoform X2 n=1 Tax=Corylus avellana TaxID=13451 RepID=UPI00286A99EB|nr:probable aldehyde dehydrogenase isoform X2 [Corylus avellana]